MAVGSIMFYCYAVVLLFYFYISRHVWRCLMNLDSFQDTGSEKIHLQGL